MRRRTAERQRNGMLTLKQINGRTVLAFRALGAYTAREKAFLLGEMVQIKGLMPLS